MRLFDDSRSTPHNVNLKVLIRMNLSSSPISFKLNRTDDDDSVL